MQYFTYLFNLFTGLFGFAASHFVSFIALVISGSVIGGLASLFKRLVFNIGKSGEND